MPTISAMASATTEAPLGHWLRLLWNQSPALHLASLAPFIAGGAIHLPASAHWAGHCAAAAHASAHLVYSPAGFDATALVPIARTLLALLEDARVEALAMRELPGLARLWRPLHTATPADGEGCEPLMRRLARALADPAYADPHPWVAKGRRLFYLDEGLGLIALRTPAELRAAALRLGHDIGQMRLPFNAKGYRPAPDYRDDHRWMWAADQLQASAPPPAPEPTPSGALQSADDLPPDRGSAASLHPEWDRLIRRLRPDWCRVTELLPPAVPPPLATPHPAPVDARTRAVSRRLLAPLRGLARPLTLRGRSADGTLFDLDALVAWRIAGRLRQPADSRVWRAALRQAARTAVWLLIDQSASTAAPLAGDGRSVLQTAAQAGAAIALALRGLGVDCAVSAFSSNGRHAVRLVTLQRLGAAADPALGARLQSLRSTGSTRLGAALRHATAGLAAQRAGARWVLLLSDGQPHDVDVHDPRYLGEDARQAVRVAAQRGLRMACLVLADAGAPAGAGGRSDLAMVRRIFGAAGAQPLSQLDALPRALRRLLD
jgi:uncharacterized protein YegL